ncbi:MAG: hypothetical protein NTU81_00200 [Candidatus Nomurabacteria bacterium]|nr:hypothetical protein [Candidatus Nomurabacteria bacterium]
MENSFQTSFIPKKPITSSVSSREPTSLFSIIATFLLILSIIAPIGLFFYKSYLTKQKESLSASLLIARNSFEKDTIDELGSFDKRIGIAKQLLNSHIILSPMFSLLGDLTIPSVQYTNFSQQSTDKGFTVTVDGIASDYKSIVNQSEAFGSAKGSTFKNVLFSNLTKDKNNNVSFNLKFDVAPSLLSYKNNSAYNAQAGSTNNPVNTTVNTATPQSNTPASPAVGTPNPQLNTTVNLSLPNLNNPKQ